MEATSADWLIPIFGLVAMLITSLVKKSNWSQTVNTLVLTGVSIVMAGLQLVLTGYNFTTTGDLIVDIGAITGVVLATATVVYKTWFEKTQTNETLTAIGSKPAP